MNRIRYSMLIMAIFMALTLSALNVAPALADESIPTPDPTSNEEVVVETEATPNPEEEATPPDVSEVNTVSDEESMTVAEVIESLPENTELIVVDENGETLPLASEEAAEILEVADPQWCPVGVTPGGAGCSGIKDSFNGANPATDLLQWLLDNQPNKAGVIWIDEDYDSNAAGELGEIVLDGDDFTSMDNFALTINGGWVGAGTVLNVNNPSEFYVPFRIIDWTGAITINNIVIDGATGSQEALEVITQGTITLNNVDVQNNTTTEGGAQFTNSSGTGNIVINDSTFNGNTGSTALLVDSHGTVTLKNVTVNGNSGQGADINNEGGASAKAVTLNGTNHFNYNGGNGLYINTDGAITINNITAMGNTGGSGAYLDNCEFDGIEDCGNLTVSAVTIKGTNNFSDNGWDGLRVYSSGVITISNVTTNGNGTDAGRDGATDANGDPDLTTDNAYGKGVYLNNYGSFAQKNVTLSGVNTFNGNASNGLTAIVSGLLTVSNITANENGCDTTTPFEDGSYCAGAYLEAYMGVTQTGYGRFSDNAENGLTVINDFKGSVTLNNLFADGNGGDGVLVIVINTFTTTPLNVAINGINVFTNNLFDGLEIDSDGAITLNNLTANYNGGFGVAVDNGYALTAKAVTIKGASVFNGNGANGLEVFSKGVITTNGITAELNGNYGTELNNCLSDPCLAPSALAVTMNGNNFFDSNGSDGLVVISRGAITINNLTATYNGGYGAYADNLWTNSVGALTIKGFAFVSNNDGTGLEVYSNGAITLANITANNNNDSIGDGYGAYIDNNGYLAPTNVTITGTNNFNGNANTGLFLSSIGVVTLTNITANENVNAGAFIENDMGSLAKAVTLNGNNTFNSNAGTGLEISSLGAIKVNNVMANNNTGLTSNGAELDNDDAVLNQSVTITGFGIFSGNGNNGLEVHSHGNITLANIASNANFSFGTYIETEYNNLTNTTFANVTMTGVNTFNENGATGLTILADGNITVSNITANNNVVEGAILDNDTYANPGTTGIRTVTVSGTNMFNGNDNGLLVYSNGTVSLTRITANFNNNGVGDGIGLLVSTEGAINLTCGSMYSNTDYGYILNAGSGKVITIKGVFTFLNGIGNNWNNTPVVTRTCALP